MVKKILKKKFPEERSVQGYQYVLGKFNINLNAY